MAAEIDAPDEQDQSEVFDEDNNELEAQRYGGRDNEQTFEDLPDVLDVTQAMGDADDDETPIGDDMDDDEIVASAEDDDTDDAELRLVDDDPDGIDAFDPDEVELEYVGDLNDVAAAASAAQSLESDSLSDADLRELDYKDEFTRDEDEAATSPR